MDVVGIVERFRPSPNDGERGRDVGRPWRVRKLHVVAVNNVAEQLSADVRDATLDIELAHEIRLHDELGDVLHLDFDALLDAVRDEDLGRHAGRRVDSRTETGSASNARSDSLQTNDRFKFWLQNKNNNKSSYVDASDEDVVAAIFCRVVSAPMSVHAPIARIGGRNAFRARRVGRAVEKGEIGGHEIRTRRRPHRQFGRKMICVFSCQHQNLKK